MDELERRRRLEALFAEHAAAVRAYALRRIGPEAADDTVSEVFVVACRRLERVPPDALPWLLTCARRVIANQRRGARRRDALVERRHGQPAPPPPEWQHGGALLAALAGLRERDREVLLLVAWEGLEPARAAAALECSLPAFTVRLHRARRRLAAALDRAEQAEQADSPHPKPTAAIVVAAIFVLRGASSATPPSRATTGAVIVHYTATSVERVSATRTVTIRREVWLSGRSSHIDYSLGQLRRGEVTSTAGRVQEYLAPARGNVIVSGRLAKGPATCTPTLIMCGFRAVDPVAFVRALVRSGALAHDGSTVLNGRTLDVLQSPRSGRMVVSGHPGVALRVLIDPDTSVPVEILVGHAASAGWTKIRISGYERVALTAQSDKLLQMSPHPGASHACRRFYPDDSAGNC